MPPSKQSATGPFLQIAIPSPLRSCFDYLPPADSATDVIYKLSPGIRIRVPFGRREVIGVLIGVRKESSVNPDKLKSALEIVDKTPLFPEALMVSLLWAADYYQHPIGEVFAAALPLRLRKGGDRVRKLQWWMPVAGLTTEKVDELSRAPRQQALLRLLMEKGQVTARSIAEMGFNKQTLHSLQSKALVQTCYRDETAALDEAFSEDQSDQTTAARQLEKVKPNPEQRKAITAICAQLGAYRCFLLDGITGSGKTEVYMQVMDKALQQGKQCLILIPEIGLTPQTINRFRRRFSCPVVALHSGLSDGDRLLAWHKAGLGAAGIVIGTRSAVFTPLANPGIIIIDEEHDSSFKQQEGFKYSARDFAIVRAKQENICVVLGSATPSLESLHNASSGKYQHLRLQHRAGAAVLPSTSLLDVSQQSLQDGFAPALLQYIDKHLSDGNQVLVFINRRGFAPVLLCADCGWIFDCKHCDTQLTVHKIPPSLRCHHCGTQHQIPTSCPSCHSKQLTNLGLGTQKSEQLLQQKFPGYPVLRIDRDSTRNNNSLKEILDKVNTGQPCILLGTQMLAKGHHFPNITLVAILDADAGLFSPDFRGQEHMVQTLVQVSGRSGRADRAGQVVIQTRHATHPSLQALLSNDYHHFASHLIDERRQSSMPPFSYLALFRAEASTPKLALSFLSQALDLIKKLLRSNAIPGTEFHGPMAAPMEKRAGRYRVHLLLQHRSRASLQQLLAKACPKIEQLQLARKVRWNIDVDPQDLI